MRKVATAIVKNNPFETHLPYVEGDTVGNPLHMLEYFILDNDL